MKILYIIDQYDFGGVDIYTDSLITNWDNNDEFFLYINKNYKNKNYLINKFSKIENIKIIEYYALTWSRYTLLLFPLYFIYTIIYFFFKFKNKKFDVILAQNGCYPGSYNILGSLFSAKLLNIPVKFLIVHHEAVKSAGLAFFIHPFLDKLLQNKIDIIVAVSRATLNTIKERTFLLNNSNTKTEIIYNGIEYENLNLFKVQEKIKELNLNKNCLKIGILSRIEYYKGHSDIIKSLSFLPEHIKERVHLFIIGEYDSDIYNYLLKYIKFYKVENIVTFTGFLKYNSSLIISNLDIYISATKTFEGFGLSLAQAVASGIPIIATNVGAIPEYLPISNFKLINPNYIELTNSIVEIVDNYEEYKNLAIKNRECLRYFSNKIISNEYNILIRSVLETK